MDKISIIVPIWNVEQYLPRCIESIIYQSYQNLEIILVNDGSTDKCGKIIDNYAKVDNRIKVIHKKNGGIVSAREAGLKVASGEYIGFVDGDDYIEKNMFEELVKMQKETNVDILHSGYIDIRNVYKVPKPMVINKNKDENIVSILTKYVLIPNEEILTPSIWSKLFKAEIIKKCHELIPRNLTYGEDVVCLVACICKGYCIGCIDQAYYHYTYRENSLSHSKSYDIYKKQIRLYEAIEKIMRAFALNKDMCNVLDRYLSIQLLNSLRLNRGCSINIPKYRFENISYLRNHKIILYGAGEVGRDYYREFCCYQDIKIVGWVDKNYDNYDYEFYNIEDISIIYKKIFDKVVIAVLNSQLRIDICNMLKKNNIPEEKIVASEPQLYL